MKSATMSMSIVLFALLSLYVQPAAGFDGCPASMQLGEEKLVKNGAGNRTKMFLSLYDCGLYLNQKSTNAKAIIASENSMAVRLKITSKFVSQAKMVAALNDGFTASTGGNTKAISAEITKFKACFSDAIKMNDEFVLAWVSGSGVVVYKNNVQKGVINSLELKKALFGIWLGDNPIDRGLKTAMLGK